MKILLTGGNGFIGSNFSRYVIENTNHSILNYDKKTYAANPLSIVDLEKNDRYTSHKADICNSLDLEHCFNVFQPDVIVHMAAESHVDRSIESADAFLKTNIMGTHTLLKVASDYYLEHQKRLEKFMFLHVSTDEVYGSLGSFGRFLETDAIKPNSPYSASKAASDCLVNAWHKTYGLPVITTHCSNNFGPYQQTEKFLPTVITKMIKGEPIPVYGKGGNIRDWIHVLDHVKALLILIDKGKIGETYNIGANQEWMNLALVKLLCDVYEKVTGIDNRESLITFVADRLGHDYRYSIDAEKMTKLGWHPMNDIHTDLVSTVEWYVNNQTWWKNEK